MPNLPDLKENNFFAAGGFTIQDESSQLVAHLVNPQPGEFIVDACAGPGGKLSHMYELLISRQAKEILASQSGPAMNPEQKLQQNYHHFYGSHRDDSEKQCFVNITAFEKHPRSFQRMISNLKRLRTHGICCYHQDFLNYQPTQAPSKILLDAPCSGLGVLRRHPEGKLFKQESTISDMVVIQRQLLKHAITIIAPGGEITYSVCSFEHEEGRDQLKWILNTYSDTIDSVDISDRVQGYYRRYVDQNILTIYSGISDGMDGFAAFVVRKKK